MNNYKAVLISVAILLPTSHVFAYNGPPPAPASALTTPFKAGIKALNSAESAAHNAMNEARVQVLEVPVKAQTILSTSMENKAASNAADARIKAKTDSMRNANVDKLKSSVELNTQETEYKSKLANQRAESRDAMFFRDGNGYGGKINKDVPSYAYFKNLCTDNKMKNGAYGTNARKKASTVVNESTNESDVESASVYNTTTLARIKQLRHYENYCSVQDFNNGLCESPSKYPNGDSNFTLSNNPQNESDKNSIDKNGLKFTTTKTMSIAEQIVFDDLVDNLVRYDSFSSITATEKLDPEDNAKLIAVINQSTSSLNLARLSFTEYKAKRVPKNSTGILMSELDTTDFLMLPYKTPETKGIILSPTGEGKKFGIYKLMSLNNKLKLDRLLKMERIKLLLAALSANEVNSPENYNELIKVVGEK